MAKPTVAPAPPKGQAVTQLHKKAPVPGLETVPKPEEMPEEAWGDTSADLVGVALLLEDMVLVHKELEPPDAERDRALMIIAQLMRQIAKHGKVL